MSGWPLHLLRHGEPAGGAGRLLGRTDEPATAAGVAACAARIAGLGVAGLGAAGLGAVRVVASDLRRARDCAGAAAGLDARWRELDFGAWDGLAPGAIDPRALSRFWSDPDMHPPPGGERWTALLARVGEAIDALAPGPTLVVTHGGPMRAALCRLCGFGLAQAWAVDLPCSALLSFRVWDGADGRRAQLVGLIA